MMNKTKIIVNPNANLGRAVAKTAGLLPVVEELGGADWVGTVYPRHAIELARQAAEQGYERVIAVGGDGTGHEVLNGIMQSSRPVRPVLGLVPFGSGNDFSHAAGMPADPLEAMRMALTCAPRRLDVARLTSQDGRIVYFGNTLGIGFDATVTIRSRSFKALRGFLIYLTAVLQTILFNHNAPRMQVKSDSETWEEQLLMLVLCNGPREGGGFYVQPAARVDDGVLHYAAVKRISRLRMLRLLPEVMNGTHGRFPEVRMGSFERIEVNSDHPMVIHADGEIFSGFDSQVQQLQVEILPGEIEVAGQ